MLRFLFLATRGHRLRPWASPYLLWRIETYSGVPAETIDRVMFFRFVWTERKSLWEYLKWVSRTASVQKRGG